MSDVNPTYEDEVELIDIFRIFWQWKILIIAGTLIFGAGAVYYSLQLPKIFKAEMTIQPGVLKIDGNGQRVYINSLKDIAGRIDAGLYDNAVISKALFNKGDDKPEQLELNSEISVDSNVLKIIYETQDLKEGNAILNYLFDLILKEEVALVSGIIGNFNDKISFNKFEIEKSKNLIQSYEKNEKAIIKRIKDIQKDIEEMNRNSSFLSYERKKLLEKEKDVNGSLSALLYSNTIQQSIQFVNIVKKDLNEYQSLKEAEAQKIIQEKDKQKRIVQVNLKLEKERDGIMNMKILIPPEHSSVYPIKSNRKIIVLLSLVAGLFFWVFCAFIAEYMKNNTLTEKG